MSRELRDLEVKGRGFGGGKKPRGMIRGGSIDTGNRLQRALNRHDSRGLFGGSLNKRNGPTRRRA